MFFQYRLSGLMVILCIKLRAQEARAGVYHSEMSSEFFSCGKILTFSREKNLRSRDSFWPNEERVTRVRVPDSQLAWVLRYCARIRIQINYIDSISSLSLCRRINVASGSAHWLSCQWWRALKVSIELNTRCHNYKLIPEEY